MRSSYAKLIDVNEGQVFYLFAAAYGSDERLIATRILDANWLELTEKSPVILCHSIALCMYNGSCACRKALLKVVQSGVNSFDVEVLSYHLDK